MNLMNDGVKDYRLIPIQIKEDLMKLALILLCTLGLSACGLLQRHPNSRYYDDSESYSNFAKDYYIEKSSYEKQRTKEELGFAKHVMLSGVEKIQLQDRLVLKRKEDQLITEQERQQYYYYKPLMVNDMERIEFLNLPSTTARERWAQSRGISAREKSYTDAEKMLIENNDVAEGMSRKAVKESWGEPDMIEVAGAQIYGNERWKYTKMISSTNGYSKQIRIVYFEGGRVAGWETY